VWCRWAAFCACCLGVVSATLCTLCIRLWVFAEGKPLPVGTSSPSWRRFIASLAASMCSGWKPKILGLHGGHTPSVLLFLKTLPWCSRCLALCRKCGRISSPCLVRQGLLRVLQPLCSLFGPSQHCFRCSARWWWLAPSSVAGDVGVILAVCSVCLCTRAWGLSLARKNFLPGLCSSSET
jgi:hypothetical protein